MLDLKTELNDIGIPFEPIGWVKAPEYPYGTFEDVVDVRGTDLPSSAKVLTHAVSISVYHNKYDQFLSAKQAIMAWADSHALTYRLRDQYIDDEDHYAVTLTSTIIEKKGMIIDG
jgi:trans-aconitate methyltransferase